MGLWYRSHNWFGNTCRNFRSYFTLMEGNQMKIERISDGATILEWSFTDWIMLSVVLFLSASLFKIAYTAIINLF